MDLPRKGSICNCRSSLPIVVIYYFSLSPPIICSVYTDIFSAYLSGALIYLKVKMLSTFKDLSLKTKVSSAILSISGVLFMRNLDS